MIFRFAICVILATAFNNAVADDWQYTIRPGDELWTIARDYCGSSKTAPAIAKHNGIADGTNLRAGQRINIPTAWLAFAPSTAVISQVMGRAEIQPRQANAALRQAKPGNVLNMGDVVITRNGAVLVQFADNSTLAIQPNSQVLFNKLTAFGPAGMVDTHLRFARGRGKAQVQPQNRGDRFRIQTPEGIAAVRGTVFRVGQQSVAGASATNTETIEGAVQFIGKQQSTNLPAGFGAIASGTKVVKEALLPAPELTPPASAGQQETLSWQPLTGAQDYLITWSQAASSEVAVLQQKVSTNQAQITVEAGSYVVRIRGISKVGIEGFDAEFPLQVLGKAVTLEPVSQTIAGPVEMVWQDSDQSGSFTVVVSADHWPAAKEISVNKPSHRMELPAGRYSWSVRSDAAANSAPSSFTLKPTAIGKLSALSRNKDIRLKWRDAQEGERFVITITAPDGTQQSYETDKSNFALNDLAFGDYRVDLACVQNSLQSETSSVQVKVAQRPWWLAVFITLLAL